MLKNNLAFLISMGSILFLASCSPGSGGTGETENLELKDSLALPIPEAEVLSFSRRANFIGPNQETILAGFNPASKRLDFFNLTKLQRTDIPGIDLSKIDGSGIEQVSGLAAHYPDSIFLLTNSALYLINFQGVVTKKWRVNNPESQLKGIDFNQSLLVADAQTPIYYHSPSGRLFIRHKPLQSKFDKRFYSASICAAIDLHSGSVSLLPIVFPAYLQEDLFGMLGELKWVWAGDQLIWGVETGPDLYTYNLLSEKQAEHPIPLKPLPKGHVQPFKGSPGDDMALIRHIEENPGFLSIYADPSSGMIFRPYFAGRGVEPAGRGELRLLLLNRKFDLKADQAIPRSLDPRNGICSQGRLWLQDMNNTEETRLLFRLIKPSK